MRGKKQPRNIKRLLCLLIAVILVCGTLSLGSVLAGESETQETEAQTGETVQEPETKPAGTDSAKGESETAGNAESEPESNTDMGKYINSISGFLWADVNEDGTYDSSEQALTDYPVYLYLEGDTDNEVQTATTDADGRYLFEEMMPGRYVVGIKVEENGTKYLLPLMGVQKDNKFFFTPDWSKVISNPIAIDTGTVMDDIDAAMRTMPQIQPMANTTYTIDITSQTTVTSSITLQSIPGVSITSNVLTFANTVDSTDTYILTGTTSTVRVVVATDTTANITLDEASITHASLSPFQLSGTANVNLTLANGTTSTLRCSSTVAAGTSGGTIKAGLHVPSNAKLTIDGKGVLNAIGGDANAGIGGYCYNFIANNGFADAGTIIINNGVINATAVVVASNSMGSGAGIGGGCYGHGGTITINGGVVTATAGSGGAGIGGGYVGNGGIVTINGGVIKATGGLAGITNNFRGTGIGAGGSSLASPRTGTNIFTGGSIEARAVGDNSIETRVAATTTNGTLNGTQQVYCIAVKVVQGDGITPVAGAEVRIPDNVTSGYLYTATTDSTGIAYCWVPAATAKMIEAEHEDYGTGQTDPDPDILANNTNTTTIILGMRTTLSRTPNTIAFISATNPTPVTLNVKAENMISPAGLKEIVDLEWFRVATTDTTVYNSGSFSTGYSVATSGNSGTDADMSVDDPTSNDERNYEMPVSENGKYWVMVHYKDKNGVDRYQVKSIVIDNVYTPSTLTYKGVNVSDSSEIVFPSIDYTGAGVAYQLDSTTIIYSTADGTTAVSGTGAQITLTAPDQTPYWINPSPATYTVDVDGVALGEKVFTYAKDPTWWVTITYAAVMDTGGSVSIVSNTNPTSVKLNVARTNVEPNVNASALNIELVGYRDSNSATPTAVIPITTAFTPSANTTITFVYRNAAVNLTISKTVTGAYANMTKASTFTVTLLESDGVTPLTGTFNYTGGILTGSGATVPANGTFTLNSSGAGTFTLQHGQTITIAGIATSGKVRIVETRDSNYTTSYKDSEDASSTSSADTGVRTMTAADRTFDFTNARSVVPGGISTGSGGMVLLALVALFAAGAWLVVTATLRRRARAR